MSNNIFTRPDSNYVVPDEVIDAILADEASPISNIVSIVEPNSYVLDIGAGNGLLGRAFERAGKKVYIDAIEPNDFAASLIPHCYRHVFKGLFQDFYSEVNANSYDYIVMADVIEHIADPQPAIEGLINQLKLDAKLLVSLPNVAYAGVRMSLLHGEFDYSDSGILERTHLRFYTLNFAKLLFSKLGLTIISTTFLQRRVATTEFSGSIGFLNLMECLQLSLDPTAKAYQFLFVLNKSGSMPESISYKGVGSIEFLLSLLGLDKFLYKIIKAIKK